MKEVGREDPVLVSNRREALVVLAVWLTAMTYSVGYCAWFGYGRTTADLTYVFGFPDWIFWGVVVPWVASAAISFLVATFVMRDEDLGVDPDEAMADILGEVDDA